MKKLTPKGINYIERLRKEKKGDKAKRKRILLLLPIIAVLLVAAGVFAFYTVKIYNTGAELAATELRLLAAGEDQANLDLTTANVEQGLLQSQYDELSSMTDAMNSYPEPEQTIINGLKSLCGEDINIVSASYTASSGVMTLECTAPSAMGAPVFIRRLIASKLFANVSYYGYAGEPGDTYSFTAVCSVAAPVTESDETETDTAEADATADTTGEGDAQ